ncbi:MAG TPA: hypothetical protein VJU18_09855 [Vicinamibacteria bacterium]|nr:hypothetical protein [Vicinamibacteria bacterium]
MLSWSRPLLLGCLSTLCSLGCGLDGVFDDRLKTCGDAAVDLVNSEQAQTAVHIAGPTESFTAETFLASGASRRITLCLERGDRKSFRAGDRNAQVLTSVTCVATRTPDQYEAAVARVVFGPLGFSCENW